MTFDVFSAGFLIGIGALWNSIRSAFSSLRSVIIVHTMLENKVAQHVADYLQSNAQVFSWGDRRVGSGPAWVRPKDRVCEVELPSSQPRWVKWRGCYFTYVAPSCTNPGNVPAGITFGSEYLQLSALRGTLDIAALTKAAVEFAAGEEKGTHRFFVKWVSGGELTALSGAAGSDAQKAGAEGSQGNGIKIQPHMKFMHWTRDDIGTPRPDKPFEAMSLCPEGQAARHDFRRWLQFREWYKSKRIPWRRGHLYYGPTGTGKTSLARALAQEADIPVFVFDLSTLTNWSFTRAWLDMQASTPCMAIIEDIDGTFHKRENTRKDQQDALTYDCLLNATGGMQTCDGVFIVVTTNHPELLDSAMGMPEEGSTMSSRPGRVDRAFCIGLATSTQRLEVLARILEDDCTPDALEKTDGMSVAKVTEWAATLALDKLWEAEGMK